MTPNGTAKRRPLGRGAAPSQALPGRAGRPYTSTGGGMNQRVLNSVSAPYFRRKLTLDVTPNLPTPGKKQHRITALTIPVGQQQILLGFLKFFEHIFQDAAAR